jgi:ubiquinone/menaquinone biosynthesis C-methylase UbiE
MIEKYISEKKYPTCFLELCGLRTRIAKALPIKSGRSILDLGTGYGYFAIEVAKLCRNVKIIGIDISEIDILNAARNVTDQNLSRRIQVVKMDATKLNFRNESFDIVVNFLGLEDIFMTRGKTGLQKTFYEIKRVLKPKGYFCFVAMPPEDMETEAQKLEVALFSYISDATWLSKNEYVAMLRKAGLEIVRIKSFYTRKKLSPDLAQKEIKFAIENAATIYAKKPRSFEDAWKRFGTKITGYGLGHYSKVVLMITKKIE